MQILTGREAVERILGATSPEQLFGPRDEDRRAARTHRVLAFAVHPDRAGIEGIDDVDAARATRRLAELFAEHRGARAASSTSAAHVVGRAATHLLRDRVRATADLATYATDRADVFVDIARNAAAGDRVRALSGLPALGAFVPEIVDTGRTAEREWVAYRLSDGVVPLRAVGQAYPEGLDGRDWAWMLRRILMVLDAAGVAHGDLTLDTVLVHPEQHGIVLASWTGEAGHDMHDVIALGEQLLRPDERSQRDFLRQCRDLAPARVLHEYDLLLSRLYGARRFRPFSIPRTA